MEPFCELKDTEKYPKVNTEIVNEMHRDISSLMDKTKWYLFPKDESRKRAVITNRLLDIFSHHLESNVYLYGSWRDAYSKTGSKRDEDVTMKFKNILETDFANIRSFVSSANDGNFPNSVMLWDGRGYSRFTAMYRGDTNPAKVCRVIGRSCVEDEIKRVKNIIKCGGAWYYDDMLKELKGEKNGGYYIIVDDAAVDMNDIPMEVLDFDVNEK